MMMTSLAQVRQVLTGHSDRALVIAIDALGHVHKLEMPAGAVRDVKERDTMLVLSWSFHAVPLAVEAPEPVKAHDAPEHDTRHDAGTARPPASAVDQSFMELMARPRGTTTTPSATPAPSVSSEVPATARSTFHGLADLLGAKRSHDPRST